MLKIVDFTGKFDKNAPCAALLGGFDGLHIGHRVLLEKAKSTGLPVGVMSIVGGKGEDLFTLSEREEIFRSLGVDFAFETVFDRIRTLSPAAFAELMKKSFTPAAFFCGRDFRFGYGAEGDPEFLERYTRVRVDVSDLLTEGGEKVSSSRVKELLSAGDAAGAAKLLGRDFFLRGEVVRGRQVGRSIGFPTANVFYPQGKYPLKRAVYEARAEAEGREYKGIVNYGSRPTFDNGQVLTETYLDGFTGDLYGRTVEIRFVRFLREIRKFASAEELKRQLTTDMERVKNND